MLKIQKPTLIVLSALGLFLLVAAGTIIPLVLFIQAENKEYRAIQEKIITLEENAKAVQSRAKELVAFEAELVRLRSSFVSLKDSRSFTTFIASLEDLGKIDRPQFYYSHVLSTGLGEEGVPLSVDASGEFRDMLLLMWRLEHFPYPLSFQRFTMAKIAPGALLPQEAEAGVQPGAIRFSAVLTVPVVQ